MYLLLDVIILDLVFLIIKFFPHRACTDNNQRMHVQVKGTYHCICTTARSLIIKLSIAQLCSRS